MLVRPDKVPIDHIIGYWPLRQGAQDRSAFRNHGSDYGYAKPRNGGPPGWAYLFDGDYAHVDIPYSGHLDRLTSFCISAWFRNTKNNLDEMNTIVSKEGTTEARNFIVWTDPGGQHQSLGALWFRATNSAGMGTYIVDNVVDDQDYSTGEWHHILYNVEASKEVVITVDGVEKVRHSLTDAAYTGANGIKIGYESPDYPRWWDGHISDVIIFDRPVHSDWFYHNPGGLLKPTSRIEQIAAAIGGAAPSVSIPAVQQHGNTFVGNN